ncbi:MAG: MFS transporter, partial [Sphingomonadaceae bacterium]|nr:MFS transporter [Sphingomonadaceae bacterium]
GGAAPAAVGWRELVAEGRAPALALVLLGVWVVAADALVTATILPSVGAALAGYAWFGWAGSAFMTGLVVAGASAGWLAERAGLRGAMVLAGLAFAAGCVLSAAAGSIFPFLIGRAVQGAAAGWVMGLVYVALATLFPGRHLPRVLALTTSVWGVATFFGPLLGGLFADAGAWRGVFWLFAGQAILFAAACWRLVPGGAAQAEAGRLPALPLLSLALGIAAIASAGIAASAAIAAALAALGLLLLLLAWRLDQARSPGLLPRRAADPAFPLGAAWLVYFATNAAAIGFSLYGPALLQRSAGLSALEAGYVVAIEAMAWTAASLSVAGAGPVWRSRFILLGNVSIFVGMAGLTLAAGRLWPTAIAAAFIGAGFGLSYSFISQRVIGAFDEAAKTRGSAAIGLVRNAGGAVGAALAGIAANAAGFGSGLSNANLATVAYAAFGIGVPFALAAMLAGKSLAFQAAEAAG